MRAIVVARARLPQKLKPTFLIYFPSYYHIRNFQKPLILAGGKKYECTTCQNGTFFEFQRTSSLNITRRIKLCLHTAMQFTCLVDAKFFFGLEFQKRPLGSEGLWSHCALKWFKHLPKDWRISSSLFSICLTLQLFVYLYENYHFEN